MKFLVPALAAAALAVCPAAADAAISPTFDRFGSLNRATFGGSGIPADAVAVTTVTDGGNTITLGLTATRRGSSSPAVTNDGMGTFFAQPGTSAASATSTNPNNNSLWNFSFFAEVMGDGMTAANYMFELLYDLNPSASTDETNLGVINFEIPASSGATVVEGSQNLGFDFLEDGISGVVTPPPSGTSTTFNPNVAGEYTFALRVSGGNLAAPGLAAINVNTVPEPASLLLAGLTGMGLFAGRRRRKLNLTAA